MRTEKKKHDFERVVASKSDFLVHHFNCRFQN